MELRAELIDPRISRELRRSVLRPNQTPDEPLSGDDLTEAVHIGVFAGCTLASTCLIYPDACPWRPYERPAWHLRAMATAPEQRGIGAGGAVVRTVIDYIAGTGGGMLWCNARTPAVGFYEKFGFETHGEEHLSGPADEAASASRRATPASPHFYMGRTVDAAAPASPEGVFEVADQILERLDADRQANQVVGHLKG